MAHIIRRTTLEDVKEDTPPTIWYSVKTCWWTHRQSDLRSTGVYQLPCDPRGGMLMMTGAPGFLADAEANPGHYGRHGMAAFMAAHNDNCTVSVSPSAQEVPTCLDTWEAYNFLLDSIMEGA